MIKNIQTLEENIPYDTKQEDQKPIDWNVVFGGRPVITRGEGWTTYRYEINNPPGIYRTVEFTLTDD